MKIPVFLLAVLLPLAANAQSSDALQVRSLAATCANCHGTDGRAVQGSSIPGLAGQAGDRLLQQLRAFRDGSRPATVMHQVARGYSDAQLQQLAPYFSAQAR